ncbi:MAG TPA: hypothetical protein VE961_16370 [Pyrinomonadaceae bacterium]|nr:hypothetical protein [Pyrinomonadaceae bacterium]
MRRKILLAILLLLVGSQIPFAYRRYRLYRLHNAIQQLATQRTPAAEDNQYVDYQGVIHVHSFLGGHSTGTFSELIAAARANQLDFVIMTEHPQSNFDTSAMTLNGTHEGILFVNGNEVSTANGDRLLLIPGSAAAATADQRPTQDLIKEQRAIGGLAIVAYPSESQNWHQTYANGIEIYNLFSNARAINPVVMFFDGLWSYRSYADLMFANFFSRPAENLRQWDEGLPYHLPLVAVAGNDAHSNIGLSLNDSSGNQWLGVKLDPYGRSFRVVRTHVLIKKDQGLTRESLLEALSQGHCYISFDIFGDPSGFSFVAQDLNNPESFNAIMGGSVPATGRTRFTVTSPLNCRFVLYKDGQAIDQKTGNTAEFIVHDRGRYRIELYLDALPSPVHGQPWIISNPIDVQPLLSETRRIPQQILAGNLSLPPAAGQ